MKIKANTVNTCLLSEIKKKNINRGHVEFDEGKTQFLPFLVVCHILNETETWPFVRLLPRMNNSEI